MKIKQALSLVFLAVLLLQSACANLSIPVTPATVVDTCPTETVDAKLLANAAEGYCLLYPAADAVVPPRSIVINPTSATADTPGAAWVDISVEAASGRTATQVADEQIAAAGTGFNITQSERLVDGKQAIVVDGLPGPDPWRKVFIVANARLYTLSFLPWITNADSATPIETLYDTVIDTLHFTPMRS